MAKFGDLDQYFDPGLKLGGVPPLLDKEYVLPLASPELGLWCRRVAAVAGEVNAASTDEEIKAAVDAVDAIPELPGKLTLEERVLGDVYQQMVDDKVPDPYLVFCGQTAYVWIIGGEEAARRYWYSGGRPESVARGNRAERRAQARAGQTNTAGASATPTPGSTSGTTSRQRSRRSGQGSRSRGSRS